jgi:hypothetical protein
MKRRTLDLLVSIGGLGMAGLLLIAGMVLSSNASFARTYVADQLSQQHITFKPAATLTDEEKGQACLVTYAGQALTTGKQAECYANSFIAVHLKAIAGGKTYADMGTPQSQLQAQVTQAQKDNAANLTDLQKQLATVTATRQTLFTGETLRGLLLTSYGFSVFGEKAAQFATVAYIAAGLLLLLAIAGLIHAMATPRSKGFAVPESTDRTSREKVAA